MAVVHRATPPRPTTPSRTLERARQAAEVYRHQREALERKSVVRGIFIVVSAVLIFSIMRAGVGRVFIPGWWRW